MKYYIFRHGSTYESKNNLDYSLETVKSAEILPETRPIIKGLAEYLKDIPTDYNVSSPFVRCVKTVEIVTDVTGKKFAYDDRLGEYTFQIGETFPDLALRIKDFLDDINKQNYKTIAICTHGGVIAGLKSYLIKGSYELSDLHDYPQPGVLLIIESKEAEYIDFNEN